MKPELYLTGECEIELTNEVGFALVNLFVKK